ncbi:hypothetical protein NDU88_001336, partial [Pleurodeles waltl]
GVPPAGAWRCLPPPEELPGPGRSGLIPEAGPPVGPSGRGWRGQAPVGPVQSCAEEDGEAAAGSERVPSKLLGTQRSLQQVSCDQ